MTRWLQAAISSSLSKNKADITDKTSSRGTLEQVASVVSVASSCHFAEPDSVAEKPDQAQMGKANNRPTDQITWPPIPGFRSRQDEPRTDEYGRCHTWTGRLVHVDEWRQLSGWDRHGPAGQLFCGICHAWVNYDGVCVRHLCWKLNRH